MRMCLAQLILILACLLPSTRCVGEELVNWDRIPLIEYLGQSVVAQWSTNPSGPNWWEELQKIDPSLRRGGLSDPLSCRLPGGGHSGGISGSSPWKGDPRRCFPDPPRCRHGVPEPAMVFILTAGIFFLVTFSK